ncbi:hypothetical protein E6P97_04340, partial [Patescibacteria group bacterium]
MLSKKIATIAMISAAGVLAVALTAFVLRDRIGPGLGFQAYVPRVLPAGFQVSDPAVGAWPDGRGYFVTNKILTYGLGGSGGLMSQANKAGYSPSVVRCDRVVINQTCQVLMSSKGQEYKIELIYGNEQEVSSQIIRLFKDDTYVWLIF